MKGVEDFISANYSDKCSTFNSCLHLLIFSYINLQKSNKKYSRNKVQQTASKIRGRVSSRIELEDYLRNDLVENHIQPLRHLFGLDYYLFQSGAEEYFNNIKTGILDIKVCSPLFNGTAYYIFECKRMNKDISDNYASEGVARFVNGQYYPKTNNVIAGMISFLESKEISKIIKLDYSYTAIFNVLKAHKKELLMNGKLEEYTVSNCHINEVNDFKYIYLSNHNRKFKKPPIDIYHIVFDYNNLIED